MNVGAKVYYDVATGNVLLVTSEMSGNVREMDKLEDVETHEELKNRNAEEVEFINIEYGSKDSLFNNAKSVKVDVINKKLNIEYMTIEEIDTIEKQSLGQQTIFDRINSIMNYVSNNTDYIDQVENLIIQSELNEIENGGI